jgi:hypothetical protein
MTRLEIRTPDLLSDLCQAAAGPGSGGQSAAVSTSLPTVVDVSACQTIQCGPSRMAIVLK